jgi:hypothetical protein
MVYIAKLGEVIIEYANGNTITVELRDGAAIFNKEYKRTHVCCLVHRDTRNLFQNIWLKHYINVVLGCGIIALFKFEASV